MLGRRRGRILNVASTAAFQPGPLMAVYYATKAYVLSFSEALANETAGSGVTVTALCPGPTITEFQKQAGIAGTHLFHSPLVSDARSVALAGYRGMKRGARVVVPGFGNKTARRGRSLHAAAPRDGNGAADPGNPKGIEQPPMRTVAALVTLLCAFADRSAAAAPDPVVNDLIVAVSPVRAPDGPTGQKSREILEDVAVSAITYSSDGLKVKGYLALPKKGERLPAVIFNRGGNREFGEITDDQAILRLGGLARSGYAVVASQYRGTAGGEGKEEFGGADVDDVLNLIPLLESIPRVDPTRIGMYGWSRGGMMTYLALARTNRIVAAIVGSGVTDLPDMIARRPEMEEVTQALVPDYSEKKDQALAARSAIRWVDKLPKDTPILILAGTADWRVYPKQALDMAAALLEAKRPYRLVVFEGGDHGLTDFRPEVNRLVIDWLDRYVRDRKPWPGLEPHGD